MHAVRDRVEELRICDDDRFTLWTVLPNIRSQ